MVIVGVRAGLVPTHLRRRMQHLNRPLPRALGVMPGMDAAVVKAMVDNLEAARESLELTEAELM